MQDVFLEELAPLWSASDEVRDDLPGGGISGFFFGGLANQIFMGATANDPVRLRELIPVFQRISSSIPGALGFFFQSSIFQRGFGAGRAIDIAPPSSCSWPGPSWTCGCKPCSSDRGRGFS